jgi:hypothetical protein
VSKKANVEVRSETENIEYLISKSLVINPSIKLVIPAVAERRAGIQKGPCDYWIPAFVRMTGWWISVALFNCQFNIIQYRQDLQDYLEILNSRFPDETVKYSIHPVDPVR